MSQKYILTINVAGFASIYEAVKMLRKRSEFSNLGILIFTNTSAHAEFTNDAAIPVEVVRCDFFDEQSIASAIKPFATDIVGVLCRGDKHVQFLRKLVPYLPKNVSLPSSASLQTATNKSLMRADFLKHFPEISPHYIEIHDDSNETIKHIESQLAYPVIVKPANLASSLLIQSCKNQKELRRAVSAVYRRIGDIYEREERYEEPQIIVEEYLEGAFYSIDVYVMGAGQVYYCPPVGYIPAKQLGIDDFFLYKRFAPTTLSKSQETAANETAAKAIAALGLTHTTAHVELVLTKNGWKVIELGPRVGRFRHQMYKAAYGIDHSLNDVKIHLGLKPYIPRKLKQYCAAYSVYPSREGILKTIVGLDKLKEDASLVWLNDVSKSGMQCKFAKNGGHALAEFIVAVDNKNAFEALTEKIEKHIHAVIV